MAFLLGALAACLGSFDESPYPNPGGVFGVPEPALLVQPAAVSIFQAERLLFVFSRSSPPMPSILSPPMDLNHRHSHYKCDVLPLN